MKRAFIAAPLVGTFIFLVSLLFVLHLNKQESDAVSGIASDAYHNRLQALVETYRSDLGVIFQMSMSRGIENWLTRQGWSVFGLDYSDTLESKCEKIRTLPTGCIFDSETGFRQWLKILNSTKSFEGVRFSPANPASFELFMDIFSKNGAFGQQVCCDLMQGIIFDCKSFGASSPASRKVQCCRSYGTKNPASQSCSLEPPAGSFTCPAGDVVEDCSDGTFDWKINVESPQVYVNAPRIHVSDSLGNSIRAGAVSQKNFLLKNNYRLFNYLQASYDVFEQLAYGKDRKKAFQKGAASLVGSNCEGVDEGVIDGLCVGGQGCREITPGAPYCSFDSNPVKSDEFDSLGKQKITNAFYNTVRNACTRFKTTYPDFELWLKKASDQWVPCSDATQFKKEDLSPLLSISGYYSGECNADGSHACAYLCSTTLKLRIYDKSPTYQVNPLEENFYEFDVTLNNADARGSCAS